jgi:hypothetical protein
MNIPNFKTEDDRREYFTIYNRQLDMYAQLFETTIKRLFGPEYKPDLISAPSLEIVDSITRSILYEVESEFCDGNPEYKSEKEDIFMTRRNIQDLVKQVMEDLKSDSGSNPA